MRGAKKVPDQPLILQLEIPSEVAQQEVWNLEAQLRQVAGITTELQEPKDLLAETLLLITVAGPYVGQAITVAGGINTIHDLVEHISTFLHPRK